MAYCTIDDLKKALPEATLIELTDDADSGVVDENVAGFAVDEAARVIDTHIGGLTELPLAGEPAAPLRSINADLAICRLYARRALEMPDTWQKRCLQANEMLAALARGEIPLFALAAENEHAVQVSSRNKDFTTREMDRY